MWTLASFVAALALCVHVAMGFKGGTHVYSLTRGSRVHSASTSFRNPRSSIEMALKKGETAENSDVRQLMGIKGGAQTDNVWAIRLQLCKPVTWIPLIWGVACGAAAS